MLLQKISILSQRGYGLIPSPTPLVVPVKFHTMPSNVWPLRSPPPSPLEFPMTLCGISMNIFWKHTLPESNHTQPKDG